MVNKFLGVARGYVEHGDWGEEWFLEEVFIFEIQID